uniref:Uncharacterized protein n=1 Tax=Strombidium rassoulzadegani TaxID=1082188 RepID=A0A7S3FWR1_9SPIT|mmetsp:Transcript_19302/g.32882  ORF Transcript_19302/g.32882 Transcript_19302/m.32882 type:complete len:166 (+) Transcript_19302:140-637(+)|eukprot:CAMPEP_0168621380 /NCGR_PEP_ID=MMETSP0449_2-20121227/7660_1 /TAXON_ID=1082188 /ORGANISM="Strombidium rassoulzadegani, Strain ras09" /LENGTH=165 /DNA_ID=CAMNT_0008662489 /DNA_START=73 /DNA_END=570 /DNA_ORIENTATION=+
MSKMQSHASQIKDMDSKLKEAEELTNKALKNGEFDEATRGAALEILRDMYAPYHAMILGWMNSLYPPNLQPLFRREWDPDHNMIDMMTSEVNSVFKQMKYVKYLEAKLKGQNADTSGNQLDFEMLSRLKKDLGMPVDFKTATERREEERASNAGYNASAPVNPPK